ncbi:MAG: alkaline phosphatase family protein, partial [Calditrichaeota bacterium]
LAVVVVVDQMRADHLTRFAGLYKGGFARLLREGRIYTNAHHDHAITVTAAGHATIATGVFPSRHGVISNEWYDRKEQKVVYCSEDTASKILGYPKLEGRSPARLLHTALGDWLKAHSPGSKVFAVSRKDRPAIMMGGKHPDGVYWYNRKDGRFVTSEYYARNNPTWLDAFNDLKLPDQYLAQGWKKLLPEEAYFVSREDKFDHEADGIHTTFPHEFPSEAGKPNADYYRALQTSPFHDALLFELSKTIIREEQLGEDASPDLLFIGCSAADAIGHTYGPLSQESEDHFLRLDQYLGDFFTYLDKNIGKGNYVVVLSGDHGVLPLPEELQRRGFDSRRITYKDLMRDAGRAAMAAARKLGIKGNVISGFSNGILLDTALAQKAGVSQEKLESTVAEALKKLPYIEDVYTYTELSQNTDSQNRKFFGAYRRSFHPERSPNLMIRFKPYYLISRSAQGTSHGSPYRYDTHVPIVFAGHGISPGTEDQYVRTVDIAVSLASILGVTPPQDVDGTNLLSNRVETQRSKL